MTPPLSAITTSHRAKPICSNQSMSSNAVVTVLLFSPLGTEVVPSSWPFPRSAFDDPAGVQFGDDVVGDHDDSSAIEFGQQRGDRDVDVGTTSIRWRSSRVTSTCTTESPSDKGIRSVTR